MSQAGSLEHAGIVDDAARHGFGTGGGEQDGAAFGADGLIVGDQRVDRAGADVEANQPVTGKIEPDAFAGAHGHRSLWRADGAVVGDARRDEGQIAAGRGSDLPLVGDAAAVAAEDVIAGQEIIVADIQRRGHQSANIDAGAAAEEDAVGVDEEDLAVGGELAFDARGGGAAGAVEGDGGAVGLLEIDGCLAADVEVLPVDDGALAALVDRHGRAGAADGGLAGADLPAAGQRRGGQVGGQRGVGANGQGQHQCRCTAPDLAAFAPRRSDFGRDDPGVQVFVPDQSVRAVHKVSQYAQFRPSQTRELLSLPSASFPLAEAPGLLPILVAASRLAVSPFGRVQLKPKPAPDRL